MSNEVDVHLGRKVFIRRRILGMTQKQLADACGVRFQQIQKYECGANRMSAVRLWQVAEALQAPLAYFFEGISREALVRAGEGARNDEGRRGRRADPESPLMVA